MADSKITGLTADTAPTSDDLVVTVNDPSGTPANKKVTLANLALGIGAAWTAWSPTLSGRLNDTKWTKTGGYIQIGKIVFFRLKLVANNATPMDGGSADAIIALPVTSISSYNTTHVIGTGGYLDSGTGAGTGNPQWASTTTMVVRTLVGTAWSSTVPITWTTNDEINIQGFYEAS